MGEKKKINIPYSIPSITEVEVKYAVVIAVPLSKFL
jgi:hypothetical protein